MLRLNIRQTQHLIGMRTQLGKLEAHYVPATLHCENKQARSNAHWTQPSIEIDTYESRHSYGFTNHTDFAREHGDKGFSDLKETTSKWTQEAWDNIDNGGKPGHTPVKDRYDSELARKIKQERHIVTELIPDPKISYTPVKAEGETDPGDVTEHIETEGFAKTHFTPGQVETYLKQKPSVRMWVTEGKYDIYA